MIRLMGAALCMALWLLTPSQAHVPRDAHVPTIGDSIVSGLSQDRVQITSTYNGTDLVIFGAVEDPAANKDPDIVVQVRGPAEAITVRRKSRVAGIWLNTDKALFTGMPSYYFLAATRPVDKIAPHVTRLRYSIGYDAILPENHRIGGRVEDYRQALIRRLTASGMYTEDSQSIDMLSRRLFRVHVLLPAAAPRGRYMVRVYLFRDGALVGYQITPFFVDQIGIERQIEHYSHMRPILYGILAILMAVFLGWIATVIPQLTRRQ